MGGWPVLCEVTDSEETDIQLSAMFLIGFALCAASVSGEEDSEIRDRIVGTRKLVSMEEIMKNGIIRPFPAFGPHAKGFLCTSATVICAPRL